MAITINVRQSTGAYHARAMRLGVTASSAEGPKAAAIAVCRKLRIDPALLEQRPNQPQDSSFTHPNQPSEPRP